jgi:CRISPR-associated protein Csd2
MFEHDHSAARGKMLARKLYVFKHATELGNAPSHILFDSIKVERKENTEMPQRAFEDYKISLKREQIPESVELIEKL